MLRLLLLGTVLVAATGPGAAAISGDVAYDAGLQWGPERIGVEQAWQTARGTGTVIAVIDSGIALEHEDLVAKLVPGTSCRDTGGDPARCTGDPTDGDGHGTHVAGIAAASTGNGVGIAGVAPDAAIMPIKVLHTACPTCASTGRAEDVSAAVRWAADRGADVINLSLGSTTSSVFGPGFVDAVRYAWSRGAIAVVAAGNDYVLTAELGDAPAVVVSATTREDEAPDYSDGVGQARWAVSAPGGDGSDTAESCAAGGAPRGILSTYWATDDDQQAYACLSGTSMAAPHVSGTLALLRSHGLAPEDAVQRLLATAVDLGPPGRDPSFGEGRIDAAAALAGATPSPSPTSPPTTGVVTPATPPSSAPPPPTTAPAAPTPAPETTVSPPATADLPEATLFRPPDGRDVPASLVAVALAAIVGTTAAAALLALRTARSGGLSGSR